MSSRQATIRARVPADLKAQTDKIFSELGISSTEAIRIFLGQVRLNKGLPFPVKLMSPGSDNMDILLTTRQRQAALDAVYDD